MNQLFDLLQDLGKASVLYELGLALLCLGAAVDWSPYWFSSKWNSSTIL